MLDAGTIQQSPTTGSGYRSLSLKNPSVVQGVINAEATYGPNWYAKLNDPSGKYIGSTVKPIDPAAKDRAQAVMNQTEPGIAFNEAMGKSDGKGIEVAKNASAIGSGVADRLFSASQNVAQNQRQADLIKWKENGKYWFDPNSDLKPDLDTYLAQMPKATDALIEGSPIARAGEKSNPAVGVLINPAALVKKGSFADKKMGAGFTNYVGAKAAQGAMSSGIGPQMIAGGIVGMFEGIFGWNAANADDAKNKKAATEEYERVLREWTVNKNKRMAKLGEEKYAEQQATLDKARTIQENKDSKKAINIASRRRQIATVLANAGSLSKSNRNERIARWSK